MNRQKGITLVELLVIVGILGILAALSLPVFIFFQKESDLNNSTEEIVNTLRLAQNKTLASEEASQWGVYFNTSTSPQQYILFKGSSYETRATSSDKISQLPKTLEISEIKLEGQKEVVFEKITGNLANLSQVGEVSLRLKTDISKTKTIYLENSGKVGLSQPTLPSDESRIKDSRHVHLDYSGREIATSTEKIILTFEGGVIEEIIIAENFKEGQIGWQGTILVGGENQILRIHSHQLNNYSFPSLCPNLPCTIFSIHRDRRYNNKALELDLSGDSASTPDLLRYDSQGTTTQGNSIYVSQPFWQ